MKDTAYAFAVSAVRVKETGLLSASEFEALITSADEAGALSFLEDHGYSGITDDTDGILSGRLAEITDFIMSVSPDKNLLTFLFIKNDFHNLKAIMKCSITGDDTGRLLLPSISVDADDMKRIVADKTYNDLPPFMTSPAREAWDALVMGMNGQLCEMILDRGAIEASVKIALETDDDFCIGFAKLRRKISAFVIAFRCAWARKTADLIKLALPETDDPSKDSLITAVLSGCNDVIALAGKCGILLGDNGDASDIATVSRALEDSYISGSSFISMGTAPLISYFIRTEREVSRIRMILSCKRCGFTDKVIRRRMGL